MMDINALANKYARKGILIDTNLLLVLFIGNLGKSHLTRFKRTKNYSMEDYDILTWYVSNFQRFVTTPNILTEVFNLTNALDDPIKHELWPILQPFVDGARESYCRSRLLMSQPACRVIGLTDTSILQNARKRKYLLLTDDLTLLNYYQKQGGHGINFNSLRTIAW